MITKEKIKEELNLDFVEQVWGDEYVGRSGNQWYSIECKDEVINKKTISRFEGLMQTCDAFQSYCVGWSFLEAEEKEGKWVFKSWARCLSDECDWYDDIYGNYEEMAYMMGDDGELPARYYDEIEENEAFAEGPNRLGLTTREEVGELLWANAYQLIQNAKEPQEDGGFGSPIRDIAVLLQLFWQLKNIEELGMIDLRKHFGLPDVGEEFLSSERVAEKGDAICEKLTSDKDECIDVCFAGLCDESRTPGAHRHEVETDVDLSEWLEEDEDYEDED